MRTARGMAAILALLGLGACAPLADGMYGDRYGVTLRERAGGGFEAEVRVPYHTAPGALASA